MNAGFHDIERAEWERRFRERFRAVLQWTDAELDGIIPGELESWLAAEDDWREWSPEEAADENLSCWSE